MGMLVPQEWGGSGLDYLTYVIALEEIAAGDGSVSTIMAVNNSVICLPIFKFGTTDQKQQFLQPLASGKIHGAFCLTEPQAGSDSANLLTSAQKVGDHYILNGVKQFITSGKTADTAIVFAATDKTAGKRGISAFIVPTHTSGYRVGREEKKLGQHASDTVQVILEDCKIPATYRLGAEGEGYKIALSNLEGGRIGIAAQSIGMARAAYELALNYAKERKTFDHLLFDHQAIQFRLADMATQLHAARCMLHHVAKLRDEQQPCMQEAAMAKLFASEMAEKVCSQIYEGTSDIQRMIIAREISR
jgi:alkylation response protein AidB-like acyl-CoA dehydrogenase